MSEFSHFSVLLEECIENLNIKPDGIYVDGTAGGAGHSMKIAERLGENGLLIPIDQDEDAIKVVTERLAPYGDGVRVVRDNFSNLLDVLRKEGIEKIDGLLLDLGVSSYQLDTAERGFSYMADAPLDMRMDNRAVRSAYNVINDYSADELKKVIYDFGEERFAPKIVAGIMKAREMAPINTTGELVEIIKKSIPSFARKEELGSVKRVFQAVRIEVNRELDIIAPTIEAAVSSMRVGGRIVIITFHSLEDKIIKNAFSDFTVGCTCPPEFPVCVCGKKPLGRTHKPKTASKQELSENSRSRSAKLRTIEKL